MRRQLADPDRRCVLTHQLPHSALGQRVLAHSTVREHAPEDRSFLYPRHTTARLIAGATANGPIAASSTAWPGTNISSVMRAPTTRSTRYVRSSRFCARTAFSTVLPS